MDFHKDHSRPVGTRKERHATASQEKAMTDKDKLDYLEYIKDFMDEAAKAYIRGDDDAYIGALNSADALLTGLLNDDDEEEDEE